MSFTLKKAQRRVVDEALNWYKNSPDQVFQYSGSAGTGKSVVLNAIINELGIERQRVAPMSFIGAAAIVMRLKGLSNAKTIHSWLYSPNEIYSDHKKSTYFNRPLMEIEFSPKPLTNIDLIVIDEAGAVPYNLKKEIESRGIKIIACGDLDQLPPVGDVPAYLYTGHVHILDEIVRQGQDSGIIYLANRARAGLPIHNGYYKDALVIYEDELNDEMIKFSNIVICGKNRTRDEINSYIRNNIVCVKESLPTFGEKIVCRKNNWKLETDGISLANGLIGTVNNYPDVSSFDGKSFTIDFMPDMLSSVFRSVNCDYEYYKAPYNLKEKYKYAKYSKGEKFELAYAITTHMSQGSQYPNGIYMEEYLSPDINRNLNYTGITRYSNFLIYVKKRKRYY